MKVVFVQSSVFPQIGIMYLSAIAKERGFETCVLADDEEEDIFRTILRIKPILVGISVYTGDHLKAICLCKKLKNKNIMTVLGGPHPTYYPEIIYEDSVEMIIRGEAEGTFAELLDSIKEKKSLIKIKNLWIKKNNKVYKNELRGIVNDLDSLPVPDRSVYYKSYPFLREISTKQFLTGRGCPYLCTFCSNHILRELYRGKGKYLRRLSPRRAIDEIVEVKIKYGMKTLSFSDDVFATDNMWLDEFIPLYKKRVGLPFMCNLTANLVTPKLIKKLKMSGCYGISMGIESGNENIRTKVLKKYISNKQIIFAGRVIKQYGLVLKTYNIICLPGEEIDEAFETIKINALIKPDQTSCSFLQPFPKYEITEYAKNKGFLDKNYNVNDYVGSIYKISPIISKTKNQLENLQTFFFIGSKFPFLLPVIKLLIKLPPNSGYRLVAKVFYGVYMGRVHRLTLRDMINYARHINPIKI